MRTKEMDMKRIAGWMLGLPTLLAVAAGCNGDLPVASELTATRVMGARVQIAADPGRAAAMPGEAADVEWLVAGPTDPGPFPWAVALCTGLDHNCVDAPGAPATGTGLPVVVPFTAPDATALGGGHAPLMAGMLGTIPARFDVPVDADGSPPNHHPNLANDELDFAGALWTTPVAGDAGGPCDGSDGAPVIKATPAGADAVDQEIRLVSDGDDRETFVTDAATGATALEELQLSNFSTAGKFTASYAAIFSTDTRPDADVTMKWTPPNAGDVPAAGLTVQFHFVVRDGRGGLDWTHRSACVVP
jgi:hypothetical protein